MSSPKHSSENANDGCSEMAINIDEMDAEALRGEIRRLQSLNDSLMANAKGVEMESEKIKEEKAFHVELAAEFRRLQSLNDSLMANAEGVEMESEKIKQDKAFQVELAADFAELNEANEHLQCELKEAQSSLAAMKSYADAEQKEKARLVEHLRFVLEQLEKAEDERGSSNREAGRALDVVKRASEEVIAAEGKLSEMTALAAERLTALETAQHVAQSLEEQKKQLTQELRKSEIYELEATSRASMLETRLGREVEEREEELDEICERFESLRKKLQEIWAPLKISCSSETGGALEISRRIQHLNEICEHFESLRTKMQEMWDTLNTSCSSETGVPLEASGKMSAAIEKIHQICEHFDSQRIKIQETWATLNSSYRHNSETGVPLEGCVRILAAVEQIHEKVEALFPLRLRARGAHQLHGSTAPRPFLRVKPGPYRYQTKPPDDGEVRSKGKRPRPDTDII